MDSYTDTSSIIIIGTGGFGVDISFQKVDIAPQLDVLFDSSNNVIIGTGGFGIDISFQKVDIFSDLIALVSQYDLTDALQFKFDVRVLNNKLGLYKDVTNTTITSSTFDSTLKKFPPFNIDVSYNDFINVVSICDIISLGSFEQIYSDFNYQVKRYFHFPNDAIIFDYDSRKDMNRNQFTKEELIRKFYDVTTDENGNSYSSFTGYFQIYDVNLLLQTRYWKFARPCTRWMTCCPR